MPDSGLVRRWVHEPLVHFLAIGALLFAVFGWRSAGGPASDRIVITSGQIDSLAAGFTRVWQRPPTEQELKGLIDDFVREEIANREALAMGLDRDDTIIRRRLRQKVEFLAEDSSSTSPPTDAELQGWLDRHPEHFRAEPQVSLRQVFLNPARGQEAVKRDVKRLLAKLSLAGGGATIEGLGDRLMLPNEMTGSARGEVARVFGAGFADEVLKLEPGRWAGPIESGYGLHLVFVSRRVEGRLPSLEEIRPVVQREVLTERRTAELNAMYERLLKRYRITVQQRAGTGAEQAGSLSKQFGSR
jgi:PPIC-type PPIASE domain